MVTIKINGMPVNVPEGSRLIDVIRNEGVDVPSLCYKQGMEHYTSCMVCMVRDNDNGRYIPSCSAMVRDGMDIDASGPTVIEMRAEAIRLLLVEHRAECEAPCKLVCPYKLDIPHMNRLLMEGKVAEAIDLSFSVLGDPVAVCTACAGYCDKGCRRKKIDTNISIKNTIIYLAQGAERLGGISNSAQQGGSRQATGGIANAAQQGGSRQATGGIANAAQQSEGRQAAGGISNSAQQGEGRQAAGGISNSAQQTDGIKRFNSTLGSVTDEEWKVWATEAREAAKNYTNPTTLEQACEEASRCMHCDCRAANNCGLRDTATVHQIKNPKNKRTASPISKKVNPVSGLIFEHAKCIKCGLCVRLGATLTGQPSLCFKGRGYETIISEPLYHEFVDILNDAARRFSEICPTGALALVNETK